MPAIQGSKEIKHTIKQKTEKFAEILENQFNKNIDFNDD